MKIVEFLNRLKKSDDKFVNEYIGDIGIELKNFSKLINNNKELSSLNSKEFDLFYELFILSEYAYKNNLNLTKSFIKNIFESIKIEHLRVPQHTNLYARFRKDKNQVRLSKKSYKFNSKFFKEKISNLWNETPNNIDLFENKEFAKSEIENYKKILNRFSHLGCRDLSNSVDRLIETFNLKCWHGYRQIDINVAACLLAKVNNLSIQDFSPVLYPCHYFKNFKIKKILEETDNFFDHHLCFVPSLDKDGQDEDFKKIKNNDVTFFLLAEKDGEFYFIKNYNNTERF